MQNTPTPAHENVRRYRQRMQQQGLRLIRPRKVITTMT